MDFVWSGLKKLIDSQQSSIRAKTTLNTGATAGATTTNTTIHNANQDWRYVIGAVLLGGVAVYWIQGNRAAAERRAAEERAAAERAAERLAAEGRAAAERQASLAEHRRLSERIDAMFTAHMDIVRMILQDRGQTLAANTGDE